MYKIYFKQALQILRQNMVMSIIAILGTALAIMMITGIIVAEEVKNISVAPEANRHRTFYVVRQVLSDSVKNSHWSSNFAFDSYYSHFRDLEIPERTSVSMGAMKPLSVEGIKGRENARIKYTDADYFKIISLAFVAGRAYTEEEFQSGVKNAIISEGMAKKLMKDENPLAKTLLIDKEPYHIIGVVKDVSAVFRQAKGDVWVPYTSRKENTGAINFIMLARDKKDYPAMYAEIREREKKYNSDNAPKMISVVGPVSHQHGMMDWYPNSEEELKEKINVENRKKWLIIGLLILVPAINLSGFSFSRIKKRMSEIGVRKAFGAKKYVILIQVLYENFITSLLGGILGLVGSYVAIVLMKEWLLDIPSDNSVPVGALISPAVLLGVFVFCMAINLLSSGIPAWRASRVVITNSLNQNDK